MVQTQLLQTVAIPPQTDAAPQAAGPSQKGETCKGVFSAALHDALEKKESPRREKTAGTADGNTGTENNPDINGTDSKKETPAEQSQTVYPFMMPLLAFPDTLMQTAQVGQIAGTGGKSRGSSQNASSGQTERTAAVSEPDPAKPSELSFQAASGLGTGQPSAGGDSLPETAGTSGFSLIPAAALNNAEKADPKIPGTSPAVSGADQKTADAVSSVPVADLLPKPQSAEPAGTDGVNAVPPAVAAAGASGETLPNIKPEGSEADVQSKTAGSSADPIRIVSSAGKARQQIAEYPEIEIPLNTGTVASRNGTVQPQTAGTSAADPDLPAGAQKNSVSIVFPEHSDLQARLHPDTGSVQTTNLPAEGREGAAHTASTEFPDIQAGMGQGEGLVKNPQTEMSAEINSAANSVAGGPFASASLKQTGNPGAIRKKESESFLKIQGTGLSGTAATESAKDQPRASIPGGADPAQEKKDHQSGGEDRKSFGQDSQSSFSVTAADSLKTQGTPETSTQTQKPDLRDIGKQLSDACRQAAETGRSEIRIHLSPKDLGGINIRIVSQFGAMSLQITADQRHTGEMLSSGIGDLTRSMNENGVNMNHIEILGSSLGGAGTQPDFSGGRQESGGSDSSRPWPVAAAKAADEPAGIFETGSISIYA